MRAYRTVSPSKVGKCEEGGREGGREERRREAARRWMFVFISIGTQGQCFHPDVRHTFPCVTITNSSIHRRSRT